MFLYKSFVNSLINLDFRKAMTQISELSLEKRKEIILKAAYDTESIITYTFVCFLIEAENNFYYHEIAMELMIHVFQYIEGAYSAALYHLRCLCFNDPSNIEYMELLLFFWTIPEKLINDEEALRVSKKIIEYDPTNLAALKTMSKINNFSKSDKTMPDR